MNLGTFPRDRRGPPSPAVGSLGADVAGELALALARATRGRAAVLRELGLTSALAVVEAPAPPLASPRPAAVFVGGGDAHAIAGAAAATMTCVGAVAVLIARSDAQAFFTGGAQSLESAHAGSQTLSDGRRRGYGLLGRRA